MTNTNFDPGPDHLLPDVSLVIGGKQRKLVFDMNAIAVAEKATGINLLKAAITDVSATNIRGMLYAALLHDDPKLTVEEVGSWLTLRNVGVVRQAILAAWIGSVGDDAKGDAAMGEAQPEPTSEKAPA